MFSALEACHAPIHSPNPSVPLYQHQQADIYVMRQLETTAIPYADGCGEFKTTMGILADKPGAGKSFTALAHVASSPVVSTDPTMTIHMSYYYHKLYETRVRQFTKRLKTNLFVVPRPTIKQWGAYARNMACMAAEDVVCWNKITEIEYNILMEDRFKFVIITDRAYKMLVQFDIDNVLFQRLFIDEADSVHIPNFAFVEAQFTWFITATPASLVAGQAGTAAFKSMFGNNSNKWKDIIVKSTDTFVEQSLQLPPYTERAIRTAASHMIDALRTFVSADVITAINACDIAGAIMRIGCNTSETDDGIIAALTSKMRADIETLTETLKTAAVFAVPLISSKINDTENRIQNIIARVKEAECCPIGLDEIEVKAVTPCCQNAFEFGNLIKALERTNKCPLCKSQLAPNDLLVQSDVKGTPSTGAPARSKTKTELVKEELTRILADPAAKVLIFSDWSMQNIIESVLPTLGATFKEVKGNFHVVAKAVNDFDRGLTRVLLLNAHHFGAGLNIQSATHILTVHAMPQDRYLQLIGRAQRPGRVGTLSVLNIRYDGEI